MKKVIRQRRRTTRTFSGYIGLLDGRPDVDVWPTPNGSRVVHVFLNASAAKRGYADVQLVTVTGVWIENKKPKRAARAR